VPTPLPRLSASGMFPIMAASGAAAATTSITIFRVVKAVR
jgi:hypothetical protein